MRLLQLATGDGELLDLHPNVTVVTGLGEGARRQLLDAVIGLARGAAPVVPGLLEAHGVLFDLTPEMLALLEVAGPDLRPVVGCDDLPEGSVDPAARERVAAQRALAVLETRAAASLEARSQAESAVAAATDAVERARRAVEQAESDAAGQIEAVDALAAEVDRKVEERRRLEEERPALVGELEAAVARRAEVEEATTEVRSRRQELALRCADLAVQLDEARLGRDPDAVAAAEQAAAELAEVEQEAAASEEAGTVGVEAVDPEAELATERLARVQRRIEELEPRLAAFAATEIDAVRQALDRLRSVEDVEPVPVPEALALADQLEELDADLVATSGIGATTGGLAEARARVEAAQRSLIEAEQAARSRVLDRDKVDQLEETHARLLELIDKSESRLAGARARRQVEGVRVEEQAILDELGFTSYSDYMMGYSLLHVDPQKEVALEVARGELARAEDAFRALEAETEAELARARRMERRRHLMEQARTLLGGPAQGSATVDALRALRRVPTPSPELTGELQRALDKVGVAVGDEDLARDDLVLLAELWLTEAADAAVREQEIRAELDSLLAERVDAVAAVEAEGQPVTAPPGTGADDRAERLAAARARMTEAEERRQAHLAAEATVAGLAQALAEAAEHERVAADAAAEAEATVVEAAEQEAAARAALDRLDAAREAAERAEAEGNEALRVSQDAAHPVTSEDRAASLADAEAALAASQAHLAQLAAEVEALAAEHEEATAALAALDAAAEPDGDRAKPNGVPEGLTVAEEVEWYLLARLAAQRAVSLGGSVPLLLDDALNGLPEADLTHVLGRLERMADAVQVIVISEDPLALEWARRTGPERAAVVTPEAAAVAPTDH